MIASFTEQLTAHYRWLRPSRAHDPELLTRRGKCTSIAHQTMVNSSLKVTRSGRFDSYPHDSAVARQPRSKRVKVEHNNSHSTQPSSTTAASKKYKSQSPSNDTIATRSPKGPGRPPSKISATRPNGRLIRTVNGVQSSISPTDDALPSPFEDLKPLVDYDDKSRSRSVDTKAEDKGKRILRSQDGGSRSRSDLAHFFPDYEDIVFGDFKETDHAKRGQVLPIRESPTTIQDDNSPTKTRHAKSTDGEHFVMERTGAATYEETFNFTPYQEEAETFERDPLQDSFFVKAHRRGERKEKQLRNIEKEHAMHEKLELERLFDELRGPDWLRTMGISGVTETTKKEFELHRENYIRRVKALIDKFSTWREQEKEMKIRSDRMTAAREEAEAGNVVELNDQRPSVFEQEEVDPSARQLLQEANSASRATMGSQRTTRVAYFGPPEPQHPFTSFFSKPYLRDAAISKHRRGRGVFAFGHAVPEMEPKEFALPSTFVTEEALIANARKRRRLKRQSRGEAE